MREKLQQLFICDPNRFTDVINNHDQKYSENEEENIETYALAPDLLPLRPLVALQSCGPLRPFNNF